MYKEEQIEMDNSTRNGVTAIVEYDYIAKEPDELDLIKGAIIRNIKIQQGGWWEGTLASNGKTGMFPDNFVRILDSDEKSPVVLRDKSATIHRKCKVIYSYTQNNEDELSLGVGNIIEVLGEVEEGWWKGKLGDKVGVFPSNFVEPLESSPILANRRPNPTKKDNRSSLHSSKEDLLLLSSSPSNNLDKDAPLLPPKPVREYCRVSYPYEPQNEDELELHVGDIITILNKDLPDKGWWKGELRSKVGVFPDNFVTLLPPEVSPSKDSAHPDRPPSGTSKVFIKKSGSASSSHSSSNRKDSFGSRDSLNDILSETGIVSGNVAAQRKSLENKNIDLTNNGSGGDGRIVRRSLESKTTEIRKSLESMDEKKTPPPVLTKKPAVPVKKSTTVTSVAGNLLSGLKHKVKSVEQKLSSSHDSLDGAGSSKPVSQIPDSGDKGVTIEKLKKDDSSEFDNIERGSMLPDMRAGRAKAPKRRPPSAAINVIGESNNNNSIYLNGVGAYTFEQTGNDLQTEITENEELAKPKPREWEKKKAPWMEELKASQAKKTSPNIEPRATPIERHKSESETIATTIITTTTTTATAASVNKSGSIGGGGQEKGDNMTRSITSSYNSSQQRRTIESISSASFEVKTSGNYEQQGIINSNKKETITNLPSSEMTKSMSSNLSATTNKMTSSIDSSNIDDVNKSSRPTSLSIRNRSVSPVGRTSLGKSASMDHENNISSRVKPLNTTEQAPPKPANTAITAITAITATTVNSIIPVSHENVCTRVVELEQRIVKLEGVVQSQSKIIEELVRSLREETDKVKGLRNELDKYAQCVTQV